MMNTRKTLCHSILLVGLFQLFFSVHLLYGQDGKPGKNEFSDRAAYYNYLFSISNYDSLNLRFTYAKTAFMESNHSGNIKEKIQAMLNIGVCYNQQYRYDIAMEWFMKAKQIADSAGMEVMQANALHEIGDLYLDMRNLSLSHEYFSKAIKIRLKYPDKKSISVTLNGLALTHWLQGKLDTALTFLFETLTIEESLKNQEGISRACNNIGIVYHEKREFDKALIYLFRSLEINEKQSDYWSLAEACNNIGETYISMGNYAEASKYLDKARQYAFKIKAFLLIADNYRYMSRLMKRSGNYQKSLEYFELFHDLDDSLFNRNKYTMISEIKSSFEIEKKEQSIKMQEQKIELLEEKEWIALLQRIFLSCFIILILITAFIFFNRQKKINERNKLLIEKDKQIQHAQALLVEKEKQEKEGLARQLEQTNKFLIDFALTIGMKNVFLAKIKEDLKNLARKDEKNTEIRQIILQVNQNLRYNKELVDLQRNVEKVNHEFLQKLHTQFPDLTENDRNLAVLVRLNFSSKEIADLRAVSIKAVEMSRYRLRKRFNIEKNESLTHFLQNL